MGDVRSAEFPREGLDLPVANWAVLLCIRKTDVGSVCLGFHFQKYRICGHCPNKHGRVTVGERDSILNLAFKV